MHARWVVATVLMGLQWAAAEVTFSSAPKAGKRDGKAEVSFALSASADVEVAVLDAKGTVVRHLAAGVLGGPAAPPAPLAAGLSQTLAWDGNDDLGKPAAGGPFQFRVRAGMGVKFGRMIGESAYTGSVTQMPYRAPVNGLTVDEKGRVFVKMMSAIGSHGNSGMWPWHVREFDRKGAYVRTLLPYPPSTAPDKATGFDLLGGKFSPALQTSLYPVFATLGNETLPRTTDGRLVFVHTEKRQLNFLALDGSNDVRTVTLWGPKSKLKCPSWLDIQVALSPDGKTAYLSNVAGVAYDGKTPADIDAAWPQGRVYRLDLTKPGSEPEPFHDLTLPDFAAAKYWMPSAWDKKTATAGIDTDAQGNVYICDLVNGAIVEVGPDGKRRSATPVAWPDKVIVGRKSGALYVVSRKVSRGGLPPATLIKITGRGDSAKVAAQLTLTGTIGGAIALDESGDLPVLLVAGQEKGEKAAERLLRIEDRGAELAVVSDDGINRDGDAIAFVGYMDVDPQAELVYVTRSGGSVWRYKGDTGEGGLLPLKAVDLAIGPGGDVYTWGISGSYEGPLARFDRDLKPKPLASTGSHTFGYVYGRAGRGASVCGMDVDARGRVFATFGSNDCHVRAYDADGALVDFVRRLRVTTGNKVEELPVAVDGVSGYGGSIRVDAAGNIYLLQQGVPKDWPAPAGFEKDPAWRSATGTIWKFPPGGGSVRARNHTFESADGAIARYPGCGPVSRWNAVGSCACTKPRFDVDGYGRLYIPDAITFSVSVRDNAGNEIAKFGSYGNFDCRGPGSKEPSPEIPLGWPVTAGASDRFIYVGDCLNHRVVRVDKKFTLETTIALP